VETTGPRWYDSRPSATRRGNYLLVAKLSRVAAYTGWIVRGASPIAERSPDSTPGSASPTDDARELYAADFVLIRPDQIVAWRSNSDAGLDAIMRKLCGFFPGVPNAGNLA
jgi:hypothetical protein